MVTDFDNDGYRDIIVTNGFPKDVSDHDFIVYQDQAYRKNVKAGNHKTNTTDKIAQLCISK